MGNATEFENIVLCLGSFHMTKIFLGCLGKYLRNNGAESIWLKKQRLLTKCSPVCTWWDTLCKVFLLCETMERLQWSAFFKTQEPETYKEELLTLQRLQDSIAEKDADRRRELLEEFSNSSASMIESFQKLENEGCKLS